MLPEDALHRLAHLYSGHGGRNTKGVTVALSAALTVGYGAVVRGLWAGKGDGAMRAAAFATVAQAPLLVLARRCRRVASCPSC